MSVYDIFKSISTVKVPVKNIEKSTSSGRENLNFHSTSNNSGISNRNNLLTTETQGITSPSCITSFSDEKDSFDVSFINMQNSLEKTRQWRFLRSHLYIPSLVQFAKANKFDLQRFEKKVYDFIISKDDSIKIKVPENSKMQYIELCRCYCISAQETRNETLNSSVSVINLKRNLETRIPEVSLSMACSTSSLPLPSVSAELPIVIFSISEGASQFAPSIIPLHAPFKVSHLVTYLTDAINQAMSICTENESVARNGIKITDVQMKGPSVVYFHFGSIADALSVYECVSTHSVHVHLCNKVKSSSSSVSSSKRVKLKDIFNISVSFDLTTSKMKYLPHYSRFNTTPTTQIVEERSIGGDEISQDIDPLLLKFGSVNSTGVGSGGGAYKRLILQPRSPDLPSSLPPMQMTASKVPDINRLTPSSSSSLSTPIKVSELTSTPLATTQAEISLPAVRLSESFTDLTSASELDLRNRFDQLGEDDTLTDFDELLEDEASYSMLPGFRSGHSKLHATDFTCPITRETINTAMRSKYGHYYERAAIMEWVSAKHQCPLTKLPLEMIDLSPSSTRYDVCLRRLQKEHLVLSTTTINTAAS